MVLKTISPGCRVRASLMLFLIVEIIIRIYLLNILMSVWGSWLNSIEAAMAKLYVYKVCLRTQKSGNPSGPIA